MLERPHRYCHQIGPGVGVLILIHEQIVHLVLERVQGAEEAPIYILRLPLLLEQRICSLSVTTIGTHLKVYVLSSYCLNFK